jgi:hypothetical protein
MISSNRNSPFVYAKRYNSENVVHEDESYESFNSRYLDFFKNQADDVFELSRGLNNMFCTDIIPTPEVLKEVMYAARRLNSFALAARTVEALERKLLCDQKSYDAYLSELQPTLDELGIPPVNKLR